MIVEEQPAVDTLLPHRPPMLLLETIAAKTSTALIATSSQRLCAALLPGRAVSGLLAIELLAQAAAAFAGLTNATPEGAATPATPGMLLGGRKLELSDRAVAEADCLLVGIELRSPLRGGGLAKFAGTVWTLSAAHSAELQRLSGAQAEPCAWLTARLAEQWLARSDVSVYLPAQRPA